LGGRKGVVGKRGREDTQNKINKLNTYAQLLFLLIKKKQK